MRLFFAIDLPPGLRAAVADLQRTFETAPGLRFTAPEQAHITMKFLGDVEVDGPGERGETRLQDVKRAGAAAVDATDLDPFEVDVGGLGVFPSLEYITVLWAGVRTGTAELTRLHRSLEAETTTLGFDPARDSFTPHVTLARMDDARGKETIQEAVRQCDPTVGQFEVSELRLKRSTTSASGPSYDTLARFPL